MTPEKFVRDSWRGESTSASLPPIAELRERADRFRRKIHRRNLFEYLAGVLVIAGFGLIAWLVPIALLRIGATLIIGGTCVVLWQLHRRTAPLTPPENGGQLPILEYQRQELVRQRDALESIFTWYLLPIIPGVAVIMAIPFVDPAWPIGDDSILDTAIRPLFSAAVLGAVYAINKIAARKLQGQIDEIEALRDE